MAVAGTMAEAVDELTRLRARLADVEAGHSLALDALQALVVGFVEVDAKTKQRITYAKVVDDRSMMTENQQRSLRFAQSVLAEAGR